MKRKAEPLAQDWRIAPSLFTVENAESRSVQRNGYRGYLRLPRHADLPQWEHIEDSQLHLKSKNGTLHLLRICEPYLDAHK